MAELEMTPNGLLSVGGTQGDRYRIIARRYWFSGPMMALAPVLCVAMRSKVGESWAAYIAGVDVYAAEDDALAVTVARLGAKLDEQTARGMFHEVEGDYRA